MIRRAAWAVAAAVVAIPGWWRLLPDLECEQSPERGVGIALVGCAVALLALAVTGQLP